MRSNSAISALKFATCVPKNVRSISKWNTASYVHKHVEIVLMTLVKWLDNQENIVMIISCSL